MGYGTGVHAPGESCMSHACSRTSVMHADISCACVMHVGASDACVTHTCGLHGHACMWSMCRHVEHVHAFGACAGMNVGIGHA